MIISFLGFRITLGKDIIATASDKKPIESVTEVEVLRALPTGTGRTVENNVTYTPDGQGMATSQTPKSGERSSIPDINGMVTGYKDAVAQISPEFAIELLPALEHLAKHNADISYAVDNIVQLGSTDFAVEFSDEVSDDMAKKMNLHLATVSKRWYNYSDVNGLVRDLLTQVVVTGAVSAEIVPDAKLKGVAYTVLVNPKNIRFVYKQEDGQYHPYQVIQGVLGSMMVQASGPVSTLGLKELNTASYKYIAGRRFSENPYAVPSFLSAVEATIIERDMINNFAMIIKKQGLLGFLEVLLTPPQRMPSESDEAYLSRCRSYINSTIPEIEKSQGKGYVVGFEGSHEFKMHNTAQNAGGVKELFDLNSVIKMAGLKQDPSMLGKNFTTTETLGRVLLTKLSTQVVHFQQVVAAFLRELYMAELRMAGFKFAGLEICFEKPLLGDAMKEEQTKQTKIANLTALYNQGIISQQMFATEMGYEKPEREEPIPVPVVLPTTNPTKEPKKSKGGTAPTDNAQEGSDVQSNTLEFTRDFSNLTTSTEFDYSGGCNHSHEDSFEKEFLSVYRMTAGADALVEALDNYYTDTVNNYGKAVEKATKQVGTAIVNLGEAASLQMITDTVLATLLKNWKANFTDSQEKYIKKNVEAAYKLFRQDHAVFGDVNTIMIDGVETSIPKATFGLQDIRTMEYYKKSDSLYLGRFITDEDTKKKITKFIKDEYVSGNLNIGKDEKALKAFRTAFGDVLKGEEWKIQRVINTTVNSMRNQAAARYIEQAGVTNYKIVGVNDRLQCDWCKNMQGRTFSVATSLEKADRLTASNPEQVKEMNTFVNSLFKKAEDMKTLTDAQLQLAGVGLPAFHSHCRDVIVADI